MGKYKANMVNAKFEQLFTPPVFWYANMAFTIFAIIYLLLSIYLPHIWKEQICANPFLRPLINIKTENFLIFSGKVYYRKKKFCKLKNDLGTPYGARLLVNSP